MTFEPQSDLERALIGAAIDPAHRPQSYRGASSPNRWRDGKAPESTFVTGQPTQVLLAQPARYPHEG